MASATGMYIVVFSSFSSALVDFLAGNLDFRFAIWIGFWCAAGTYIGLRIADSYMKGSGKNSFTIWIMMGIFILSGLINPIFGGISIKTEAEQPGFKLWGWHSPCH